MAFRLFHTDWVSENTYNKVQYGLIDLQFLGAFLK